MVEKKNLYLYKMGPRTRVKEMIKNETGSEGKTRSYQRRERERESIASTKKMMISFVRRQVGLTPKGCSIPSVSR